MTRFEKWSVLASTLLVAVTGVIYFWMKYAMTPLDEFAVINHPLQPWTLKAHILFAPLLVFAVGLIAIRHVWRHYQTGTQKGRVSGLSAGLSLIPMVLTGYLIQSVTAPLTLTIVTWLHIASSTLFSVAVLLHAYLFVNRVTQFGRAPRVVDPPTRAATPPRRPDLARSRPRSSATTVTQ
jgi:hypothetical protein